MRCLVKEVSCPNGKLNFYASFLSYNHTLITGWIYLVVPKFTSTDWLSPVSYINFLTLLP